ncbi:hypothetical protein HDE_04914 [Halotydeus destructor]|nr:hypothetical protein HDE_04914 [Halotydeus destructor]
MASSLKCIGYFVVLIYSIILSVEAKKKMADSDEDNESAQKAPEPAGPPMPVGLTAAIGFGFIGLVVIASYIVARIMCDDGMEELTERLTNRRKSSAATRRASHMSQV